MSRAAFCSQMDNTTDPTSSCEGSYSPMKRRTVKPEFFNNHELFKVESSSGLPCRVAFAGLWCASDRDGYFKWEPARLKSLILPYDDVDMEKVLRALEGAGFVYHYVAKETHVGWIPTLPKHQPIHKNEASLKLPKPPAHLLELARERHPGNYDELRVMQIPRNGNGNGNDDGLGGAGGFDVAGLAPTLTPEQRLIVACNQGMHANPLIAGKYNPLPLGHSFEIAQEILNIVPLAFAMERIFEIATKYKPSDRRRQITTLSYCRAAVIESWEKTQAAIASAESPIPTGPAAIFEQLRTRMHNTPGGWKFYMATPEFASLPAEAKAGIKAMGGIPKLAEANEFTIKRLRAQFIDGYTKAVA